LFTEQMRNTKIQRWGVMLAEYGAKIEYRQGRHNIRADTMSRIKSQQMEICTIDTEDWINPDAYGEDEAHLRLPVEAYGINLAEVQNKQEKQYGEEIQHAGEEDSPYEVCGGLLYSIRRPTPTSAIHPRLVLPSAMCDKVIDSCHKEVGHMGLLKTLERIREAFVWPGMRLDIKNRLRLCGICKVVKSRPEHPPMGEMPIATYPFQMIAMDLIGPLCKSTKGNCYVLNIIDHCTGWVESYPLPDKTCASVWHKLSNDLFPRHSVCEILLTDCGKEFGAKDFDQYLKDMGIEHRRTSPYNPKCNGRIERFNKTLKEMLRCMINNDAPDWENKLSDALMAYRNSVSTVTGYTPFQLLYARRARLPLTRALQVAGNPEPLVGRMEEMCTALRQARQNTEQSRRYNRERLQQRANVQDLKVGDTVILKATERLIMTTNWDPEWEITRLHGNSVTICHQQTQKQKVVNRDKVRLVDPNIVWDDVRPRPKRRQYKSAELVQRPSVEAPVQLEPASAQQEAEMPDRLETPDRLELDPLVARAATPPTLPSAPSHSYNLRHRAPVNYSEETPDVSDPVLPVTGQIEVDKQPPAEESRYSLRKRPAEQPLAGESRYSLRKRPSVDYSETRKRSAISDRLAGVPPLKWTKPEEARDGEAVSWWD
jgi:transposase InsO family protein